MADLISYPFRLDLTGAVAVVAEGSDQQLAEELAVAVLTRPGERPLVPDFGVADPAFTGFDQEALALHIQVFGPEVQIEDVQASPVDDSTEDVVIEFSS